MKKTYILTTVLCTVIIGLAWIWLSPRFLEIRASKQKMRQIQEEMELLSQISKRSLDFEKRFTLFQKDVQQFSPSIPGEEELDSLVGQLRSTAESYDLLVNDLVFDHSFTMRKAKEGSVTLGLQPVPVHIRLEGEFFDIYQYLEYVEKWPCFLNLETMEIVRKTIKGGGGSISMVQANMAINILTLSGHMEIASRFSPAVDENYHPVRLSSSLINTQKSFKIMALGKNIFEPPEEISREEGAKDEYGVSDSSWRKDEEGPPLGDLTLNGIVSYQGEYIALVNNENIKKGDMIGEMEVIWITKDRVCLAKGSEKIILNLNK